MANKVGDGLFYSARLGARRIDADQARHRLHHLYLTCQDMSFFQEISNSPKEVVRILKNEAIALLGLDAFPLDAWTEWDTISEASICDVAELLYQRVSKPEYGPNEVYYSSEEAQSRFRQDVNNILRQLGDGYTMTSEGQVERTGTAGLDLILGAEIPVFDPTNVDNKVRDAVTRWKQRNSTPQDRQEAVRLLSDVFEWLKARSDFQAVLGNKDTSDLFNIANNFSIRHHNPKQLGSFDSDIWHRWMFHFYLATYHATIRQMLKKPRTVVRPG